MTSLTTTSIKVKSALLFSAGLASFAALAETNSAETQDDAVLLGEIEVWTESFAQSMGTQKIDRIQIENMPVGNGTISELLKNNPNVQYSATSSSANQGEIAPENISIHGERFYNNSWMIDGLSNNDNINPGANGGSVADLHSANDLPNGGTQSFWINSDLVESVEVFDSNISAKYGQFTGGVVDAKLVSPDTLDSWGSISYRTTRDSWTNFHFEDAQSQSDFESANTLYNQPQFTKNIYSLNVNQPLSEQAALLFSYNRTESEIPFFHSQLDYWEDQTRLAETYLLKGIYEADNGDLWNATFIYSPHESGYAFPNTKDGAYTLSGGGYRFNLDWEHLLSNGKLITSAAFKRTSDAVEYETANAFTWEITPSIDWVDYENDKVTSASEGGYGHTETSKDTVTIKQDLEFEPIAMAGLNHKFTLGWQADFAEATYQRKDDVNFYVSTGLLVPTICYNNDPSCLAGEQAADILLRYQAEEVSVGNDHYAMYAENQMKWQQLEMTLGLRADYDEFLSNLDIAPRFAFSYDLFNNQQTMLFGGVNRYYANSLLAYALNEKRSRAVRYSRGNYADGWQLANADIGASYISGELNTPYSDELNLGVKQQWGNSEWTFKWVNRQGHDQFTRYTDENNDRHLTNDGSNDADNFTLSASIIDPIQWRNTETYLSLGASYTQVNSSFTSYDPGHLFNDATWVYAAGEFITIDEVISRNSFSQPWTLYGTIDTSFVDWGITWTQDYRFTSGYTHWESSGVKVDCPTTLCNTGSASEYAEVEYSTRFVADWHFGYSLPVADNSLTLSVDVMNVFDSKVEGEALDAGSSAISYQPGRRFWLNARYSW